MANLKSIYTLLNSWTIGYTEANADFDKSKKREATIIKKERREEKRSNSWKRLHHTFWCVTIPRINSYDNYKQISITLTPAMQHFSLAWKLNSWVR